MSRSGRGPTSDLAIHLAVHAARPDIGAVAHAHLPAAMGLTLAGEVPDPSALPETALLLPRLPYLSLGMPGQRRAGRPRSRRRSTEPPEPLAPAVLLERHGAVAVGADPDQAVDRLELVEVLCRTWRDALLIRAATGLARYRGRTQPRSNRRDHERTRLYLAELLGTFMFMMVGYMSVAAFSIAAPAHAGPPGRAVRVRFRPAGRDLRFRPYLRAAISTRP